MPTGSLGPITFSPSALKKISGHGEVEHARPVHRPATPEAWPVFDPFASDDEGVFDVRTTADTGRHAVGEHAPEG